ncbi:MAG: Trigger factor [Verrucomicrobiales bacterium]|nr:Trigger factor [Verrucomicrobiales bacterium]
MRVEVDATEVDASFEALTRDFQREVKLPGFRPGKAPRQMVEKSYTKQIEDEVRRKLIGDSYRKAVTEQKLDVIGAPDIEEIQFSRGQALQFAATVETAPEFEMPEYKGLPARKEVGQVTDADMDRAVNILRQQRVTYNDVDRPAKDGDMVVVNYTGTSDGKPLIELAPTAKGLTEQKNFWLHIKPGQFIPGFTEQLIGATKGEKRTVTIDFPADFVAPQLSGKQGVYEVEIVQVKEQNLPEVTDEFAKGYGAESAEKLREGIRKDLENELKYKQNREVRNQLVRALLDKVHFELPESVVQSETRQVIYDLVRENQSRGVSKELIEKQKDEIYNFAAGNAKERVKISFLLARIAEKEGINVSQDEIANRILFLAQQNNIRPEKFVKELRQRDGIPEIRDQILMAKAIDFLEKNAAIEEVQPAPPAAS